MLLARLLIDSTRRAVEDLLPDSTFIETELERRIASGEIAYDSTHARLHTTSDPIYAALLRDLRLYYEEWRDRLHVQTGLIAMCSVSESF